MSTIKDGLYFIVALALAALWIWGVISYAAVGNGAGAVGAFLLPPLGILHGAGLL